MLLAVLVPAATSVVATTRASAGGGGEENKTAIALPPCKPKCGNVPIPYPFGIGDGCYSRPEFNITCIESNNNEPTLPRLMKTRIIVSNISLEEGELHILQLVNRDCYNRQGIRLPREDQSSGGLRVYNPYTISGEKNSFFVVGCDTKAYLFGGREDQSYTTGCVSVCRKKIGGYAIDKNESCSGMGCCETKIPPGLNNLTLWVESYNNHMLGRSRVNLQVKTTTLLHAREIPPAITGLWVTFAGVGKASKGTHTSMVAKILMSAIKTPVRMDSAQIYKEITLVPVIVATATKTRLRASKFPHKHA
ncbi:unnamed protein product [Prunus armeniaca]|uniref:Wall-associated receptor kinase galacturonan-binding domain-containing protein n=1 Tax=Prunus armeniaca TaxID=36596 RepID=A0A6J5WZ79_PRUAR|nr:unnamed protein product [Prunus armeniaca]